MNISDRKLRINEPAMNKSHIGNSKSASCPCAPDMKVNVGGIAMRNPVMAASGTFGYGREYSELLDLNGLGAIVVKGISLKPAPGNPPPRLKEVPGGLINAIGLQNPGVDAFLRDQLPFLRDFHTPVIVNIWGNDIAEYAETARKLDGAAGVAGLEINISCPNIKKGGIAFGTDPGMMRELLSTVRAATSLPMIPKLSPIAPDIASFARIAEECGANAISLINSVPAMAIDVESRQPALGNITGGLTGPAIHPVAVRLVWEACKAVRIPVIGMGGVSSAKDALEFIIAGATAVAVGTATFSDPMTMFSVIAGIEDYLQRHGIKNVNNLIGSLITD